MLMTYVLKWLGQPVYSSRQWIEIHDVALANGFAVLALGHVFALVPGATIDHVRPH